MPQHSSWGVWSLIVLIVVVVPAAAQDDPGKTEYVPRSEYEQLKEDFEALKKRVEQRKQRETQAVRAKAREYVETRDKAVEAAEREENRGGFRLLPESEFTPGYVEARREGWMEPGKLGEMNARIATVGDLDLYMAFDAVGRLQALEQDDVAIGGQTPGTLEPGFQTAFGNLAFLADFNQALEVYFDIFIASRPHADRLQGDEGYVLVRELPSQFRGNETLEWVFDTIDIKAGEFEVDFGDAHYRRSNNAQVQKNPLIGNYVVDPRSTDIGLEVIGTGTPIRWLVGVGSGTDTGDFQNDSGYSLHGKVWAEVLEDLRAAGSVYYVDHSGNPPGFPAGTGTKTQLFSSNRSGGPYAGILDDGDAPGQVTPGAGQQVTAAQADLTWAPSPLELYGHVGWMQDADVNGDTPGTPRDAWYYYAGEGVYHFTPRLYTAARYSGASAIEVNGVSSDGLVHRVQVGGGYWVFDTVLGKLEYVYQVYDGFEPSEGPVSGVDAWLGPQFQGVVAEISFSF